MINFVVWLLVGSVVGWIASVVVRAEAEQTILRNVVFGIAGAAIGGGVVASMFGDTTPHDGSLSMTAMVFSLIGSVTLLGLINLWHSGTSR